MMTILVSLYPTTLFPRGFQLRYSTLDIVVLIPMLIIRTRWSVMTITVVILHRFFDYKIPSVTSYHRRFQCCHCCMCMLRKMEEERDIDLLGSNQFSGSGNNCLKFNPEEQKSWNLGVVIVSSVATVACILAIISILAFKGHKRFVHRLTLYLMVAALLEAVASVLAVIPVYHKHDNGTVVVVREGFEDFCAAR